MKRELELPCPFYTHQSRFKEHEQSLGSQHFCHCEVQGKISYYQGPETSVPQSKSKVQTHNQEIMKLLTVFLHRVGRQTTIRLPENTTWIPQKGVCLAVSQIDKNHSSWILGEYKLIENNSNSCKNSEARGIHRGVMHIQF